MKSGVLGRAGGVHCKKGFIGSDVTIDTTRPDLLSIDEGCVITSGVKILTHFHNPTKGAMFWGPVTIGKKVFLGMNVLVVNSVTIGDNAVVAAGAVVTKDIPPGEIWGGVPAKFIKKVELRFSVLLVTSLGIVHMIQKAK